MRPKEEFIKRLDTLKRLLLHFPDVKLIVPEQDAAEFLAVAAGKEDLPEGGGRCTECFSLRLGKTAEFLSSHSGEYDAFATTLTVSPRKNAPLINAVGVRAAERFGVRYLTSDFKKHDGWLTSGRLAHLGAPLPRVGALPPTLLRLRFPAPRGGMIAWHARRP